MKTNTSTPLDTVICHSAEDLSIIENDTITLTVTSPPYWNAIDYEVHAINKSAWYRSRKTVMSYQDYLNWLILIFNQLLHKTKPGGFCAIIVGTVLHKGIHYPLPFDITAQLSSIGWKFHQDFIWHKTTAGIRRAGAFIQHPYPGYFYPNIMTEYILVFKRPGPPLRPITLNVSDKVPIDDVWKKDIANNVWHIAPVPPRTIEHPCPFPEEIPYRLITLYSLKDSLVFDPFAGSGQTLKVARHLQRRFLGFDIIPQYVEYAKRRINEPLNIRKTQLIAHFGHVPHQPPDSMATKMSATTLKVPDNPPNKAPSSSMPSALFDTTLS